MKVSGDSGSSFCQKARSESAAEAKDAAAVATSNPADIKKFEEQAIAQLPEFVSKAPSQLKSAVQVLAAADVKVANALKADGYSYLKLPSSVLTSFDSPAFEAATTKIADYMTSVCGINPDASATP